MPVDVSSAGGAAAVAAALSGASADAGAASYAFLASSDLPATLQRTLADLKAAPVPAVDGALALVAALARGGRAFEAVTLPLLPAVLDRLQVSDETRERGGGRKTRAGGPRSRRACAARLRMWGDCYCANATTGAAGVRPPVERGAAAHTRDASAHSAAYTHAPPHPHAAGQGCLVAYRRHTRCQECVEWQSGVGGGVGNGGVQ